MINLTFNNVNILLGVCLPFQHSLDRRMIERNVSSRDPCMWPCTCWLTGNVF
jgi:hypothetical protein